MRITILAIGKCKKNSPEAQIIAEYVKRSSWSVVIKEKDNSDQVDEAKFLQENIPYGVELAAKVENWQLNGVSEICFLIGGADGHLQSTRDKADLLLSFGKLTLPHMLMRVVLTEQIYRIQTIISHHPYHRE